MQEPLENAELLALAKTVEAKSLSRAAAELGIPRSTLSRRLARLEERLGARLLRRTTRSLLLTDAGETLYRHARIVLDAVAQAEASVRRSDDAVRGDLRVSLPPAYEDSQLELLNGFAKAHPHVRVHAHFGSQHVDLRRDGYDIALRAGTQLEPGLVARTLLRTRLIAVASPAYLAAHGTPRSKRELKAHRCLMGFARGELPGSHWPTNSGPLSLEGSFASNDVRMLTAAAVAGLGIAYVPEQVTREPLSRSALVQVLPGSVEMNVRLSLVYAEREFLPPPVRAFVAFVVGWLPRFKQAMGVTGDATSPTHTKEKRRVARQGPTARSS